MYSNKGAALKKLKTLVYNPKLELETFRERIEREFKCELLPSGVELRQFTQGGVTGGVPCDYLTPEIYSSDKIMLYVHGGSFVGGSRAAWRSFCASLADYCACRVIVPEIHLAPAYPFPAAIEDIKVVFQGIYEENPGKIILAADGSGAAILLAMVLKFSPEIRASISRILLFSPWLDMSNSASGDEGHRKAADKLLSADTMRKCAELYTYSSNITNPLVSPLLADDDDLARFPPVLIQAGGNEMLCGQIAAFQKRLQNLRCECQLDIWPEQVHLFQMADEHLADSHLAIERIGNLIKGGGAENAEN